MKDIIKKIQCNKIKCKSCGDIIESKYIHDLVYCSCNSVAVDGGLEYLKRIGNEENFEELSFVKQLVKIDTTGFKIVKNVLYKKDGNRLCPKCHSDNITYAKGDRRQISDDSLISLACHDCETIFEFIDVKYKNDL